MILAVTGALGFLGHHFVSSAVAAGHRCWLVDAETYAADPAHLEAWDERFIEYTHADICTLTHLPDVDALVMPGEITRFVAGVAGSTQQWQTQVTRVDRIDANTVLAEANMTVKLLNKDVQTGMAVYRLIKVASGWRLAAVDMFEIR